MMASFIYRKGGSVKGTVNPPEAGIRAFLFSVKDTLSVNVVNGVFQFVQVPAGSFNLMVEAAPPYRNGIKTGIVVVGGELTNAGQVDLQR